MTIIGVAARDEVAAMVDFVDRHGLGEVENLADVDEQVWRRWSIPGQPAWVFVDGETGEATTHLGPLDAADLDARLAALAG